MTYLFIVFSETSKQTMFRAIILLVVIASALAGPVNKPQEKGVFCKPSEYLCAMNQGISKPTCVTLDKFCNGKKDCPENDDEQNDYCRQKELVAMLNEEVTQLKGELEKPQNCNTTCAVNLPNTKPGNGNAEGENNDNEFSGTGFMFSINNMVIDNSAVKMFNQNSDNIEKIEPTHK